MMFYANWVVVSVIPSTIPFIYKQISIFTGARNKYWVEKRFHKIKYIIKIIQSLFWKVRSSCWGKAKLLSYWGLGQMYVGNIFCVVWLFIHTHTSCRWGWDLGRLMLDQLSSPACFNSHEQQWDITVIPNKTINLHLLFTSIFTKIPRSKQGRGAR